MPCKEIVGYCLQIGGFSFGFAPDATEAAEIVQHKVDRLIFVPRHDRGRPAGLTHTQYPTHQTDERKAYGAPICSSVNAPPAPRNWHPACYPFAMVDAFGGSRPKSGPTRRGSQLNLHQRDTFIGSERENRVRIGTLLADLQRSLEVIKIEIEIEEGKTQWRSPEDPRYPAVARAFRTRHDNLAKTIGMIEDRAKAMMVAPTIR